MDQSIALAPPALSTTPRKLTQVRTRSYKTVKSLVDQWHSTLRAPVGFRLAFLLYDGAVVVGVSTWGRPTARLEDQLTTLEHTRMALCAGAPRNTASWFIAQNRKWIRENMLDIVRLIAYINLENHTGVTYRADNWRTVYRKKTSHSWSNRPGRMGNECHWRAKFERQP